MAYLSRVELSEVLYGCWGIRGWGGGVGDDSKSATPVASIVVPGRGLRVTPSTWARAHRKKVV